MSAEIAYELHSYTGGRWKIQGFFDDRDLAILEARRMDESRRFPAIRVVEERFDPETGGYKSRTVYRSSALDQHNDTALKERAEARREATATRTARNDAKVNEGKAGSISSSLPMLAVKAVLLVALGFAAIWALNHFGNT
ncbi:hypothetical protein [Rhodovibrio salinarum]|uniref:Uncharacterized protein n=1 Tax=Rhodovibrio salinarum TaxID=1087 RepID=A0A934QHJ8_9PROT|nr:hypothetical protein [Rhodovibrio salinarum]MBK1697156.1 hypothetical protein [Rhodovibrio salinarum]